MTLKRGLSLWRGAQKNSVRRLRSGILRLVRPQDSSGAGSVLRRHARLSGNRSAARSLQTCGSVKREKLAFLADNPLYTKGSDKKGQSEVVPKKQTRDLGTIFLPLKLLRTPIAECLM